MDHEHIWFLKKRKRLKGLGEVLVHLGFLLVFAGFVLGSIVGTRDQGVGIAPGETMEIVPAGISLRLDTLQTVTNGSGRVLDTVSSC